jgi:hypothetical protein
MQQYGFSIAGDYSNGLPFEIGTNTAGNEDPNKFYDFVSPNKTGSNALSKLSFTSSDSNLAGALSGRNFSSFDELAGALQGVGGKTPDLSGITDDAQALLEAHYQSQLAAQIAAVGGQAAYDQLYNTPEVPQNGSE